MIIRGGGDQSNLQIRVTQFDLFGELGSFIYLFVDILLSS